MSNDPTSSLTLNMPASFPGAAKHLEHRLAQLAEKCRPGYCVSKGVRDQIQECHAVASATVFAIENQPVSVERAELVAAWNDLPDSIRCHPGLKRLFRACQVA